MADIIFTPENDDITFRPAAGTETGSFGAGGSGQEFRGTGRVGDQVRNAASRVSERASQAMDSGRNTVAGGLDSVGDRLDNVADGLSQIGGAATRASGVVRGAGEALDSSADYVRNSSLTDVRSDLAEQIRSHPLLSVGVAIGAGYLLSKLLD
jgi:ElaB/YqjD/DUF883 family membrane-anchored ribosome-binding protein